jgi:hypothetical protein
LSIIETQKVHTGVCESEKMIKWVSKRGIENIYIGLFEKAMVWKMGKKRGEKYNICLQMYTIRRMW